MTMKIIFISFVICVISDKVLGVQPDIAKPIDLTWKFDNDTIYWTGIQKFIFTKMVATITEKNFWYAMNEFCAGEHGGTHLDAPYHFFQNGKKVGDIPLEDLIVKGAVIDISEEVSKSGGTTNLEVHHLRDWQQQHGSFEDKTVLLIKFGWSKKYTLKEDYLGTSNKTNKLEFPGVSADAAQWLAAQRGLVGVGLDTASVDPGVSDTYAAHRTLAAAGLYVLENVKLVEQLPVRNFTLLVMPMKISQGTGAPLRLVALPNNNFIPSL